MGLQFKAQVLKATAPTTAEGIERYLASGQMRGIGPAMAKRIVSAFSDAIFDVIEATPERLEGGVLGSGPCECPASLPDGRDQKSIREIMIFLHAHEVRTARAVRIFKTYGHEAIRVMTEDPYRLARDVRGIGFRTADAIAMKLGVEKTAPQRLRAGISFALQTATDEGHCGLPVENLTQLAQRLLEVEADLIRAATEEELLGGEVLADTVEGQPCIFLKGLHSAERVIAERLVTRASGKPPWSEIDLDKALPWVEQKTGRVLSVSQQKAVGLVLSAKVTVITGGPGVGKTSTLDSILRIVSALAAPTVRAARSHRSTTRCSRGLLYTGVTRGKKLVVLVAEKKAIAIAVRGGTMKRRWTKLREWLTA